MKPSFVPLAVAISALALHTSCKPKPSATAAAPSPAPEAAAPAAPAEASMPAPVAEAAPAAPAEAPAPQGNAGGNRPGGGGGQGNFQQRAEERMQRMKTELGLTDDQAQKITAVFQEQFGALRGQGQSMSREDRRAAFEKARTEINAEVEQILTPEQKPKWEAYQKEQEERRAQRRQGGGGGN